MRCNGRMHPEGLAHDLPRLLRRRLLLAGAALPLLGRGAAAQDLAGARCAPIPPETAGPFPGNGSNRNAAGVANALALTGIVRRDIRSSIGAAQGRAEGVPLTLRLRLVAANTGCTGLAGRALYLWQCDREGRYSMYSPGAETQNYLRGVQVADADGWLSFTTVFPGCYPGRWPHLHFEVYRSLDDAGSQRNKLRTSQMALPEAACRAVYGMPGYEASAAHFRGQQLAQDGVFRDGAPLQLVRASGSVREGYTAELQIGLAA